MKLRTKQSASLPAGIFKLGGSRFYYKRLLISDVSITLNKEDTYLYGYKWRASVSFYNGIRSQRFEFDIQLGGAYPSARDARDMAIACREIVSLQYTAGLDVFELMAELKDRFPSLPATLKRIVMIGDTMHITISA